MHKGVLVTGASSGIGAAIARELATRGFRVFGTVRREGDRAGLEEAGAVPVLMDVTDRASIARARDEVTRALDGAPLAGLVNNAGVPAAGPLELLPLDQLRRVLEVNLVGVVAVTQAFLPLLKAAGGRIVNISSVSGRQALPFMGPYAASKFALEAASDSLRRELLPFGVDVIVVEPGSVQSRIWEKIEGIDLSPYRGTSYERVLDRFRSLALRSGERGLPAVRVARAVARALTARRPPTRILVVESPLAHRLVQWLPDRLMDWLVERALWRKANRVP
jgi:NAD(P)-dependent dehydrogenase (short-subunit alcohol dehydrogenase family)